MAQTSRFPGNDRLLARWLVALLSLAAILTALWQLHAGTQGLEIRQTQVDGVPMTMYLPVHDAPAPVAVIAHGFAGSRQMMQPLAITLARNGYIALTFDFPGHGANTRPFVADLLDEDKRRGLLGGALETAVTTGLALPRSDGRLALLGHSMAGDIMLMHMHEHPDQVQAAVLLSPYISGAFPMEAMNNLLFVFGSLEPAGLHGAALAAFAPLTDSPTTGITYGDPEDGSARRLALAGGVEHIGVLYAEDMLRESLAWLNGSFGPSGEGREGYLDRRGPWLGLLFLGIIALAWPLSRLLPRVAVLPVGLGLPRRQLLKTLWIPALLTPLLLWAVPVGILPLLLVDYLALHFAVYGLLCWAMLGWSTRRGQAPVAALSAIRWQALGPAILLAAGYLTLAIGIPIHLHVTGYLPGPERALILPLVFLGMLLFFSADEWMTRGAQPARGAYALTKVFLFLSLILAVALRLETLFFLIIILPAILVCLTIYGLLSSWIYRATGHPWVGATAVALALAWGMSVTFPLVGA
ncbi:alpha/beta hydrolase family protein [Ectothiorhodospira lacustris]|uniref:alpha/beta hydrolase family protein n=1 Tax=Ectothiorhodospira lacustris TaxID=2899127 RepID=UPI001EE82773|nr:alpha/beta fold hydrolase [Ectothiorhodospira lacustris]MCG5499487.1 alpha/beta fold hydrolase [Ectothiorhodospira lacustris]